MLILNPDLINSCRVCRSPNQDGDYESLYQSLSKHETRPALSEAGILYENLLDISLSTMHYYPQFLCNSCDLQMKLFKKLKDKAYKTLEYLQHLYGEEILNAKEDMQEIIYECKGNESQALQQQPDGYQVNEYGEYQESGSNEYQENIDEFVENAIEAIQEGSLSENQCNTVNEYQEYTAQLHDENTESEYQENTAVELGLESLCKDVIAYNKASNTEPNTVEKAGINIYSLIPQFKIDSESNNSKYTYPTDAITHNSTNLNENSQLVRFTEEPIIDQNDYVTEIYELLDDETKLETYSGYNDNVEEDVCIEEKTETNSVFSDIAYVFEEEICNIQDDNQQEIQSTAEKRKFNSISKRNAITTRKREYRCQLCQLEFNDSQEHKLHRIQVHNEKYPCNICSKEFKSIPSLQHHMKIHDEQAAYQCKICQKTFNQKVHYNYHMNRHNNVRNFKCDLCEKAFLSKADLKIHLRLHTGQRPYVCNICGKDYLMMEHLKTHLITHTDQYFQCEICKHKFTTHKTLRLHVKTIHEDEPRFKCNFCSKPFRRKHHLEYHLKLHPNSVNSLDSGYELIDDPDELDEQYSIDDAGFIALNDDII